MHYSSDGHPKTNFIDDVEQGVQTDSVVGIAKSDCCSSIRSKKKYCMDGSIDAAPNTVSSLFRTSTARITLASTGELSCMGDSEMFQTISSGQVAKPLHNRFGRAFVSHEYEDNYREAINHRNDESSTHGTPKKICFRGGTAMHFPERLFEMLRQVEELAISHIVSWQPHGRSFLVHRPREFVSQVMPKYVLPTWQHCRRKLTFTTKRLTPELFTHFF